MSTAASKDVKRWCGKRHLSLIRPAMQRALLWSLPSFCFFSARAEAVAEMCHSIADDLGASSCTEVLNENGKGFRLVGTLEQPLRFNNMGFDDNMVGLSAGSQNVCMLAAFGNGGVVPQNCVPIIGTQADEFNGSPEQHYFGMEGFDCGYNFMPFAEGSTISWSFPLGNSCISDADLDLGLTSLYCHFQMSCELGSTTTTTGPETTISSTSTFVTSTISTLTLTTRTATNTYTSATTLTEVTSTSTSTVVTTASTRISTAAETTVQLATTQATEESTTQSTTVSSTAATTATSATATTALPAVATTAAPSESSTAQTTEGPVEPTETTTTSTPAVTTGTTETTTTTRSGSEAETSAAPLPTTSTTLTQALRGTTSEIAGNSSCDDLPRIPNSQSLAHCLGVASGLFCPVSCQEGFAAATEDILFCNDGIWQARGECILEGASVTTESAAQVILRMNLTIEESGESSSLEWAEQNREALHVAFANSLGAHPSEIRVDVLPPGAAGRRLLAQLAFDVRITWLLGDANTTNRSSDVAVQELALLADADGMSRFGEALQSELNGTDSRLASVSVEALSTEVIDSYLVPEASWLLGSWDATACNAQCEGAMEVAQLSCSRGSWLLCSGIDKPSTERPCRQCGETALAIPSWILPTALCVGFCCCGLLGACLARHFMPNLLSHVMQQRPPESGSLRDADPKANVLSVDSVNSDPDDMAVIKRLSTIRPTLTSSRCKEAGVTIEEEEDEVQPAKTRVIWDLDLKKISSGITGMFSSKKYSSHVTPESRKGSKAPCSPPGAQCCVSADAEIDEADLENPVAMEPSWVSAGELRMPIPVLSRSERSLRSQHSKGTLLNAPCGTPVNKSETERTLKRTIL